MKLERTWDADKVIAAVRRAGEEAIRQTAEAVAQQARDNCPDGMRDSIEVRESATGGISVVVAHPAAVFVELGHYSTAGNWVPPNPFLRLALGSAEATFTTIASAIRLEG